MKEKLGKYKEILLKYSIGFAKYLRNTTRFILLLTAYLTLRTLMRLITLQRTPYRIQYYFAPRISRLYSKLFNSNKKTGTVNQINLIELALHNMRYKLNRTVITVGGMAVGISAIVFLVSIGYGLQELVISRVARLEEVRQTDVFTQPGSKTKINNDTLIGLKELQDVKMALPLIALVGKINFNNSVTDVAVYGITTDYLNQSAIKPIRGKLFDSNELANTHVPSYSLHYMTDNRAVLPASSINTVLTRETSQATTATDPLDNATTDENGLVTITGESIAAFTENVDIVDLSSVAKRKAVVNKALLNVLGLKEEDAVGKNIEVAFIATSELLGNKNKKIMSKMTEYEIVAVIPQEDTPYLYVPFIDVRSLGIQNYSQVKIVVNDTANLEGIRKRIASMGYVTTSVVDTIDQINSLFGTLRILLALIGTVALIVASLGMFNTLTVSLLERTREIGLMKAMGMKSYEIMDLFLTESMLMGVFGGILGIVMGIIAGELVGLLLTLFALGKGVGYVDVAQVPFQFILIIVILSVIVGAVTGIYPSRRATSISALNALRYE